MQIYAIQSCQHCQLCVLRENSTGKVDFWTLDSCGGWTQQWSVYSLISNICCQHNNYNCGWFAKITHLNPNMVCAFQVLSHILLTGYWLKSCLLANSICEVISWGWSLICWFAGVTEGYCRSHRTHKFGSPLIVIEQYNANTIIIALWGSYEILVLHRLKYFI